MIFSLASDIGKVRKNNEDFIDSKIIYKDDDTKIGIFALADGMGGHNKGEVASAMAVNGIIEFLSQNLSQSGNIKIDYFDDIIKQAYNHVNLKIYEKSKEDEPIMLCMVIDKGKVIGAYLDYSGYSPGITSIDFKYNFKQL